MDVDNILVFVVFIIQVYLRYTRKLLSLKLIQLNLQYIKCMKPNTTCNVLTLFFSFIEHSFFIYLLELLRYGNRVCASVIFITAASNRILLIMIIICNRYIFNLLKSLYFKSYILNLFYWKKTLLFHFHNTSIRKKSKPRIKPNRENVNFNKNVQGTSGSRGVRTSNDLGLMILYALVSSLFLIVL